MEILLYIIVGLFAFLVLKSIEHIDKRTVPDTEFSDYSEYKNHIDDIINFKIKEKTRTKYKNTEYKLISIDNKYLLKSWEPYLKDIYNIVNIFKKDNKEILCKNGLFGILIDPCREWVVIRVRDINTNEVIEYPLVVNNYEDELSPFETLDILKQLYKYCYGEEYKL